MSLKSKMQGMGKTVPKHSQSKDKFEKKKKNINRNHEYKLKT